MIFRAVKKHSNVSLPEGQTWTVTRKVPMDKRQAATLARFLKNLRIIETNR